MERLRYSTRLFLVKCKSCKAEVNITMQKHVHDDADNFVAHVNYCECGKRLVEKSKGGNPKECATYDIIKEVTEKRRRSRLKEIIPILFDKKDESMFSIAPNS
jgi:ssDNA-binding Zn-finger/Zn-ribbon topoisomerase 1